MAGKPGSSSDILDAVALLVLDMQPVFLDAVSDAAPMRERCGFAIEAARELGLRVVFTEQVPAKLGHTDPRLLRLAPQARVFPKTGFSALQAEGLLEYLRRQGIYHLLVAGLETPVCVYQTALHAHDSDFDVTVLADGVGARRLEDGIIALDALARANCHVLPAETVFYSMLGTSTHRAFPAFNELVKRYALPGALEAAPPPPASARGAEPRPAAPERPPAAETVPDVAELDADHGEEAGPAGSAADDEPDFDRPESAADEAGDTDDAERRGGQSGEAASGDADADRPRRRPRRRRGGARRRRARERAAGGQPGSGEGPPADASAAPADDDGPADTDA